MRRNPARSITDRRKSEGGAVIKLAVPFTIAVVGLCFCAGIRANAQWTVVIPQAYRDDEAIRVAVDDLAQEGSAHGITFVESGETDEVSSPAIVVGSSERSAVTARLVGDGTVALQGVTHPEGYEIVSAKSGQGIVVVVAGGSVLGDVYGLYWIWDRLRVLGRIPEFNARREPDLDIRYTRIPVQNKADIRRALRYGLNLVYGENPLRLIPWDSEPENMENAKYREQTRELAAYAHSVHLKFLAFGTDFTYHPSLLKEFGATLNPEDPQFWVAVQAKYRMLFDAMPELDGVGTFTADEQQFWGSYKTFDVMHGGKGCDWSLEKRYRTYVQTVWDVVVGERNKLLLHRTWATNSYEQQAQPAVFRKIFTADVPAKNLYLIPSFTQNDRWWFQAYNPTINQTPHHTMVVCETMDYHGGGGVFPTYPGAYFQAGLEYMLDTGNSNLKGLSLDVPSQDDWQTRSLTAYTVSRLAWDHHTDPREIAEDFAAIHFGQPAAKGMADLYLLSPVAYKYGLYIEPVAYGQFNALPHIRVGQFVVQGYSRIDGGRAQVEFLRTIYLRCKPWKSETLAYVDHGLQVAENMQTTFEQMRGTLDGAQAEAVERALNLTRFLVKTNNLYVRTIFAYFEFRDNPTPENRGGLESLCTRLRATIQDFSEAPGFAFKLYGVNQLLLNANEASSDPAAAERLLSHAPTSREIEEIVQTEEAKYAEVLDRYAGNAVKILHWRGKIDGSDILHVHGGTVTVEHLRWDSPTVERSEVLAALPKQDVTVVIRSIESLPLHPFVLDQPSMENDYTAEIYLADAPGGAHWWEFEVYYVPQKPSKLGLRDTLKAQP